MTSIRNIRFFLLPVLCLSIVACTGSLFKNYGRIDPSREATQAFESHEVNTEYRYFTSGSNIYPNAMIGLHRDYRLDPRTLWKEETMTPARMKEIVNFMQMKADEYRLILHGFDMLDDKGRRIGIWYSIMTAPTLVRMQEDGTVRIDTPDLETYTKIRSEREGL
jgi:hypothetical protein